MIIQYMKTYSKSAGKTLYILSLKSNKFVYKSNLVTAYCLHCKTLNIFYLKQNASIGNIFILTLYFAML